MVFIEKTGVYVYIATILLFTFNSLSMHAENFFFKQKCFKKNRIGMIKISVVISKISDALLQSPI